MELIDFLKKDLLFTGVEVESDEEIIRFLGGKLVGLGYVEPDYVDAVWQRETEYPTGIENSGYNFAITHAEGGAVHSPAVALAVLKKPVEFHRIDDPDSLTSVRLVLMLAIIEPDEQVMALRKLMKKLQSPKLFEAIYASEDQEDLFRTINAEG